MDKGVGVPVTASPRVGPKSYLSSGELANSQAQNLIRAENRGGTCYLIRKSSLSLTNISNNQSYLLIKSLFQKMQFTRGFNLESIEIMREFQPEYRLRTNARKCQNPHIIDYVRS